MSFEETLEAIQRTVNASLTRFFAKKEREAQALHPVCIDLAHQVAHLTLRGGKRLRPFLCWLGYETISNIKYQISNIHSIPDVLLSAMMSLELFQTFALIHDDIIDEDRERRGGPTVHEYFNLKFQKAKLKSGDGKHSGESMAVLAGDLALVWADALMFEAGSREASYLYSLMKEQTIYGQGLDVELTQVHNTTIDKGKVDELKTAYYSVMRPLQIGAALAGCPSETLSLLEAYGVWVGRAFQLRDDFLDGRVGEQLFASQSQKFMTNIQKATKRLPVSKPLRVLYEDFTTFVLARKS